MSNPTIGATLWAKLPSRPAIFNRSNKAATETGNAAAPENEAGGAAAQEAKGKTYWQGFKDRMFNLKEGTLSYGSSALSYGSNVMSSRPNHFNTRPETLEFSDGTSVTRQVKEGDAFYKPSKLGAATQHIQANWHAANPIFRAAKTYNIARNVTGNILDDVGGAAKGLVNGALDKIEGKTGAGKTVNNFVDGSVQNKNDLVDIAAQGPITGLQALANGLNWGANKTSNVAASTVGTAFGLTAGLTQLGVEVALGAAALGVGICVGGAVGGTVIAVGGSYSILGALSSALAAAGGLVYGALFKGNAGDTAKAYGQYNANRWMNPKNFIGNSEARNKIMEDLYVKRDTATFEGHNPEMSLAAINAYARANGGTVIGTGDLKDSFLATRSDGRKEAARTIAEAAEAKAEAKRVAAEAKRLAAEQRAEEAAAAPKTSRFSAFSRLFSRTKAQENAHEEPSVHSVHADIPAQNIASI